MKKTIAALALLLGLAAPARAGYPPIQIQDEGTALPYAFKLNFAGSGVTCAGPTAGRITCTIPGGGSSIVSGSQSVSVDGAGVYLKFGGVDQIAITSTVTSIDGVSNSAALTIGGARAGAIYIGHTGASMVSFADVLKFGGSGFAIPNSTDAGASKPTCDSSQRNRVWIDDGAAGVTDTLFVCLKASADTYSWRNVTTGG